MINNGKVKKDETVSSEEGLEEVNNRQIYRLNHFIRDIIYEIWPFFKVVLWITFYCCAVFIGLIFGGLSGAMIGIGCALLVYGATLKEDSVFY